MILPFSIVPCLWEFSIAVLNIDRVLQSTVFIIGVFSLSLLLVRIANKEMVIAKRNNLLILKIKDVR